MYGKLSTQGGGVKWAQNWFVSNENPADRRVFLEKVRPNFFFIYFFKSICFKWYFHGMYINTALAPTEPFAA